MIEYIVIALLLLAAELFYFRVADKCNIIDKPNERSSHSTIVLRGGGIIFTISMIAWAVLMVVQGNDITSYIPFMAGLLIVAGVSFVDDIHSLPDSLRMVVQIMAFFLMFWRMGIMGWSMCWVIPIALFFCVGATNIINFMDGINGITAGYGLAMLFPIFLLNNIQGFIEHLGFFCCGI